MVDYTDIIRYLQNKSSGLPKTAGNKYNNAIRRMQELYKINKKNNVINTPNNAFKPKTANSSESILDALYGKNKVTPDSARDTIRKNINISKNAKYKFPTKEVANKLNTVKNIEATQKAIKVANTVGTGALATLNFFTGLVDRYEANQLYQQAIMEPDPNRRRELEREAFRKNLSGALTAGLGAGSMALKGLGKGAIYGGKAISKLAKPMGKDVATELIERGANPKNVNFLRLLEVAKRNTGRGMQEFGNTVNKYSNYLLNPITQTVGIPLLNGVSHGVEWIGDLFYDDNSGSNKVPSPPMPDKPGSNPTDPNKASGNNPNWNGGYGGYGGGYIDPGAKQYFGATGLDVNNDETKTDINDATKTASEESATKEQQATPENTLANPYDVLNEWRKRQDIYDTYRNRLLNYRDNYRNLYEQTYARNKALEGMRDFGNPSAGVYTSSMSPLDLETNEVNLDKTIADEMVKPSDEYQELLGNIALANQMGLPPEAMRTEPKRFDSFTDYMRAKDTAELNNATRQYIAKQNNAIKLMKLQIDREIAQAKLDGDWRKVQYLGGLQVKLHEMDNAAGLQKATIGAAPWYPDTQTLIDTLDSLGYTVQRKQPQAQQVQPVNQQTVRANASVQATPGNKDSNLGRAFGKYSGR